MKPQGIEVFKEQFESMGISASTIDRIILAGKRKQASFSERETFTKDGLKMDIDLAFKKADKGNGYFYNGFQAAMALPIDIEARREKSVLLKATDQMMRKAPSADFKNEAEELIFRKQREDYVTKLNEQLKSLMENDPKGFNLLMVKHHPVQVTFTIPEQMLKQQEYLLYRFNPKQYFPPELKVSVQQAFNMLAYDIPLYREQVARTGENYHAWIYPNYNKPTAAGFFEWDRKFDSFGFDPKKTLLNFAFTELLGLDDQTLQSRLAGYQKRFENGEIVPFTPANPGASPSLLVAANVRYKTYTLYNDKMKIQPHEPYTMATYQKLLWTEEKSNAPLSNGEEAEVKKKGSGKERTINEQKERKKSLRR